MTTYSFTLPDDLVDAISLRRMSEGANGQWLATVSHKFGSVLDNKGRIIGPIAPHGVATGASPEEAVAAAVKDLAKEVLAKLEEQNAVERYYIPAFEKKSEESAADLLKLLNLE